MKARGRLFTWVGPLTLCCCLSLACLTSKQAKADANFSHEAQDSSIGAHEALPSTLDCIALHDQSEREKHMSRLPLLEGSFSAQAEPRPATGADRTRSRSRVGLAYDLRSVWRAAETAEIARRSCNDESRPASRQNLLDRIFAIRSRLKRHGQRNAQIVLQQETASLNSQLTERRNLFKAGLISKREFDAFNETRVDLLLQKSELDAMLGQADSSLLLNAEQQQEIATFYQNYITNAASQNNSEQLIEATLRNELETMLLRSKRNAGDPWNFIVSGGYEALSASIESPKIPGYFQAEVKLNLGSFLRSSTPLETLRENPMQAMRHDFLTQAIRNSIAEMTSEQQTFKENLELTQLRLAELTERKVFEEAGASATETGSELAKWHREQTRIELEALARELNSKLELIGAKQAPAKQNSGPSSAPHN